MERILRTRNLFLDTSIFRKSNFNIRSTAFRQLLELTKDRDVNLVLTEITEREIQQQLKTAVEEASRSLKKAWQSAYVLRNVETPAFAEIIRFDVSAVTCSIAESIQNFLRQAGATILPVDPNSANTVFQLYFARRPPFSEGKKSEFPDAFVLDALARWCDKQHEELYVVSGDLDIASACKGDGPLFHLCELEDFIDMVVRHDDAVAEFAVKLLQQHLESVKAAIAEAFDKCQFTVPYSDIEVESVHAAPTAVTVLDYRLIHAADNSAVAEVSIEIAFGADIVHHVPSPETDEAAGHYLPPTQVRKSMVDDIKTQAEILLSYDIDAPTWIEVFCNDINRGRYIELDPPSHEFDA